MIDDSIFDINPHYELSVKEVGNYKSKIVTVDNFLAHPEKLLQFLETLPLQDNIKEGKMPRGFYPGYQVYLTYDVGHLQSCANYLINQHFGSYMKCPNIQIVSQRYRTIFESVFVNYI